jgi:GMP synthase-like glutamine amidotransferase
MNKILLIQSRVNNERIENERASYRRAVGEKFELDYLSALDERLSWTKPEELLKDYVGVIFGGSSDFDFDGGRSSGDPVRLISMIILSRVKMLVKYAIAGNIPILGICYGHQIIANMRGGEVSKDSAQGKRGSYEIALTADGKKDAVFSNLPLNFFAQYDHKDSVSRLPEGTTLLASAPNCRFAVLHYGKNVYTMQFHPEVERLHYIGNYEHHDSPHASRIIQLWLEKIVKPHSRRG